VDRLFYRQHYDYRGTIRKISEALISIFDPAQIQRTLIGAAVEEMFLENGVLLLRKAEGTVYSPEIVLADSENKDRVDLPAKGELVEALLDKRDVLFKHEIEMDPKYDVKRKPMLETFDSLNSEMVMPLVYQEDVRGIISLGRKKSGKMFTAEDVDLLRTLVNQGAVALENARLFEENLEKGRMEEELKIAHDLQSSMLPETAPDITGFEVAARSISAREVGGDFYDFIDIRPAEDSRQLGIVVGDVSGKAVSGALVMAAARSVFRVLADGKTSVSSTMKVANFRLNMDVKKGMFVALLYAVLDPGNKTVTLSNAGQTQPIILSASKGKTTYVESSGDRFPLGILPDCDYQESTVNLGSGDMIFFYTDGVVEALDDKGQMYEFDRLEEKISQQKEEGAQTALENLITDVLDFAGGVEQHDDITMVVVKVL
jgi:serine phosphatase RsbU (regulator of sigma subunit)